MAAPLLPIIGLGLSAAGGMSKIMGALAAQERLAKAAAEQRRIGAEAARQARMDAVAVAGAIPTSNAALGRRQALNAASKAGAQVEARNAPYQALLSQKQAQLEAGATGAVFDSITGLLGGLSQGASAFAAQDVATEKAKTAKLAADVGEKTSPYADPTGLSATGQLDSSSADPAILAAMAKPDPAVPSTGSTPMYDQGRLRDPNNPFQLQEPELTYQGYRGLGIL